MPENANQPHVERPGDPEDDQGREDNINASQNEDEIPGFVYLSQYFLFDLITNLSFRLISTKDFD